MVPITRLHCTLGTYLDGLEEPLVEEEEDEGDEDCCDVDHGDHEQHQVEHPLSPRELARLALEFSVSLISFPAFNHTL